MRLQVFLSKTGVCSRRSAVKVIKSGIVNVNGRKVCEPAFKVDAENDSVLLDSKRVRLKEKAYILLNKPKGVISSKKEIFASSLVMDFLPHKFRHLNPVGRLDKDTTGLILMTNDGALINRFTHPSFNVEKVYFVKLNKKLMHDDKVRLEKGVNLNGKYTAKCQIKLKGEKFLEISIHEGRNRQIRRMLSTLGYKVKDLKRIREHTIVLGALPEGSWRFLTKKEEKLLWN